MNEQAVNPKCSKCKCYYIPADIKSSGLPFKTCRKCRTRDKKTKSNNLTEKINEQNKETTI